MKKIYEKTIKQKKDTKIIYFCIFLYFFVEEDEMFYFYKF